MPAYIWTGTTSSDWTVSTNWNPNIAGGPTIGDTVTVPSGTPSLIVNANRTILSITFQTGYANTFTIANGVTLNVSGTGASITLIGGMTYNSTTTGVLSTISGTAAVTINFNGVTIPRLSCGFNAGSGTQTVTVNGTTPIVQNLSIINGSGNAATLLAGQALTITSSLTTGSLGAITVLGGTAFNIGGGGNVDVTTSGRIGSGFTVLAGTTLRMQSTLLISGGTITFNAGSSLIHNNNTLSFATASTTLNSPGINWYNVTYEPGGNSITLTLLSDLNVSNNLTTSITTVNSIIGSGGTRNINIQGNFSLQSGGAQLTMTNTIVNLLGTGLWECAAGYSIVNTTININGTGLYTIGSATRNDFTLNNTTVKLVGISTATVLANNTLRAVNCTLETNNTSTGANIIGGSEIVWFSLQVGQNAALTLTHETKFSGNLTTAGGAFNEVNGQKLLLGGNLAPLNANALRGTSTIELYGSNTVNWNTAGFSCSFQNNIVINKAGGAVNLLGTINFGVLSFNRQLLLTSGNINAGTSTFSIATNIAATLNGMTFNNLTLVGNNTITQNTPNTINGILKLNGNATFTGTAGWTAFSFTHGGAGTTCTLKAGVTYTVQNGLFTMIGTAASRAILQSDDVVAVTASIPANSNQMTLTATVPNPIGYVLGSTAFSTALPAALSNILPDRPTIVSGPVGLVYTLANNIGPTALTSYAGQLGKKAFFNVFGTTNVVYAATRDIDSLGGITIYAGQSFPDNTASPNQFRTLNWEPLIAPSGSVYYTWVD